MFLECADRAGNLIKTEERVFVAASRDWLTSVAARKPAPVEEALDTMACYPQDSQKEQEDSEIGLEIHGRRSVTAPGERSERREEFFPACCTEDICVA